MEAQECPELFGCGSYVVTVEPGHCGNVLRAVNDDARMDHIHRMECELKGVTTPKLPPPPRIAQNKSSFCSSLAIRNLPFAVTTSAETRIVAGESVLPVEVPDPAAQGQARHTRGSNDSTGGRKPESVRGVVEVGPGRTAFGPGPGLLGIHPDPRAINEVQHQSVVPRPETRSAVPAGP